MTRVVDSSVTEVVVTLAAEATAATAATEAKVENCICNSIKRTTEE